MPPSPPPPEAPEAGDPPNLGDPIILEKTAASENEKLREGTDNVVGENANQLVDAMNAQSPSFKTVIESLTKAIEAQKQEPQSPDKKIAFWTAYKKLADEFDDELQKKYGQDLDTSLIFAGLFSAVSSAFIIQIQPEIQPDPNTSTQALLSALVHNITGVPLLQDGFLSQSTSPKIVVIAQSLLYFSLFATLGAALLAVLAKQWLFHYNSVGERGTIAERGIERQRKCDGMRRWKFHLVMQLFPLLLQFSLLLFATGLSIYLWTTDHALAVIAFSLTGLGLVLYAVMIISAVVSPESPFQTSLSYLLKKVLDQFSVPQHWCWLAKDSWEKLHSLLSQTHILLLHWWTAAAGVVTQLPSLLPLFRISRPPDATNSKFTPIFHPPIVSKEASAVVWAIETSTDPKVVEIAAKLVPDLQWPVNLDIQLALKRLDDTFNSCIDSSDMVYIRDGMDSCATTCIRAFWMLDMVTEKGQKTPDLWTYTHKQVFNAPGEIGSLLFWTSPTWDIQYGVPEITPWALRFIAGRNPSEEIIKTILTHFDLNDSNLEDSVFADVLFCINSCLCGTMAQDRSLLDKSYYTAKLVVLLFQNLVKRLTETEPMDPEIANGIIIKVAKFAAQASFVSAVCAVLESADDWFTDTELRPVLLDHSVWARLGFGASLNPVYTNLGERLSRDPEWKTIISSNLPGWLAQYPAITDTEYGWFTDEHREKFCSVLSRVWDADEVEASGFGKEATPMLVFNLLAKTWSQLHSLPPTKKQVRYYINLLERTIYAAFSARVLTFKVVIPSQRFRDTTMVCLADAIAAAGEDMKHQWSNHSSMGQDLKESMVKLGGVLSQLAVMIQGELRTTQLQVADTNQGQWSYWSNLQGTWLRDVDAVRGMFEKAVQGIGTAEETS
ncbi:hypothetical protein B0H19DRAFT_1073712 [Mycena capillaripes]|nr:hypothetical protein B0H19DRAFT_1073712 [Mycena capillaripes]